jgi:protein gp37
MAEVTKIEWASSTWDPWRGCTKVSPGCKNCYAEALAVRNPAVFGGWGPGAPRVESKSWEQPKAWNRKSAQRRKEHEHRWDGTLREAFKPESIPPAPERPKVFPSKCDWLDPEASTFLLGQFLHLIMDTQDLLWLLLTKRPGLFRTRLAEVLADKVNGPKWPAWDFVDGWLNGHAPRNVWIGTSVEDQQRAEERIPSLVEIPAAVRFLSVEPLLEPVNLPYAFFDGGESFGRFPGVDWVIIGGESGQDARPCHIEWIRSLVQDCRTAGVKCLVKQLGKSYHEEQGSQRVRIFPEHSKGGDPAEWPAELRVREIPEDK